MRLLGESNCVELEELCGWDGEGDREMGEGVRDGGESVRDGGEGVKDGGEC